MGAVSRAIRACPSSCELKVKFKLAKRPVPFVVMNGTGNRSTTGGLRSNDRRHDLSVFVFFDDLLNQVADASPVDGAVG
jgi:hypothetical protein